MVDQTKAGVGSTFPQSTADTEGFANSMNSAKRGASSNKTRGAYESVRSSRLFAKLGDVPAQSKRFVSQVDQHAHANPWLHIGVMSAIGITLGYFMGRRLSGNAAGISQLVD